MSWLIDSCRATVNTGYFNAQTAVSAAHCHNSATQSVMNWLYGWVTLYFSQKAIGKAPSMPQRLSLPTLQTTEMNVTLWSWSSGFCCFFILWYWTETVLTVVSICGTKWNFLKAEMSESHRLHSWGCAVSQGRKRLLMPCWVHFRVIVRLSLWANMLKVTTCDSHRDWKLCSQLFGVFMFKYEL